jgi:murein DD-endopeptidase MepM/ murein hydrolase activator NlpD
VFDQEPAPRFSRQIWFVVIMILLLLGLMAAILLDWQPDIHWSLSLPARTPKPTALQPTPTPPQTALPTSEAEATMQAQQTAEARRHAIAPTPTPSWRFFTGSPLEEAPREEHYLLGRPIAPDGVDYIAYTYPYGSRGDGTYPIHHGVEFVNPIGTEILAVGDGTIVAAGEDKTEVYGARTDFYGRAIILKLDQTFREKPVYVLYGHLSQIMVEEGQKVKEGEVIGLVGMAGIAEGPHVHLEVRYGENDYYYTANPVLWLRPFENHGTLAGAVVTDDGRMIPDARVILYRANNPGVPVRYMSSYPARSVNPDPSWGENWAAGDLPAGQWIVEVQHAGRSYSSDVTIAAGKTTWVTVYVAG